jgi:pyrophosphatase PpaX
MFDVNGTLIDSVAVTRQAFRTTAAQCGFACSDDEVDAVKGLALVDAYGRLDPRGDPHERQDLHRRYIRARIADIHAYPHVCETLTSAKAAGVSVACVTSHGETAEACLVHTGLYSLIDCLVTQEEVARPKPHPDGLLLVLDLLNREGRRDAGDVLYVGDTPVDIAAGKAAGVVTIGVCYGASREAEIRAAQPAYVLKSFSEMRSFLPERPNYRAARLDTASAGIDGDQAASTRAKQANNYSSVRKS